MKPQQKLGALMAIAIATWQVSLTGSQKLYMGCMFQRSPCPQGDQARTVLYFMAAGGALGVLMNKGKE